MVMGTQDHTVAPGGQLSGPPASFGLQPGAGEPYRLLLWDTHVFEGREGQGPPGEIVPAGHAILMPWPAVEPGKLLLIERVSNVTTNNVANPSKLIVYDAESTLRNFVSGSEAGNLDENDTNTAMLFKAGMRPRLHWTDLDAGAECFARLQWRVMTAPGGGW